MPNSESPPPEPGGQPPASAANWPPGAAYLPIFAEKNWQLEWGFGSSQFRVNGCAAWVAFSPDGRLVAVADPEFTMLFDFATGRQIRRFQHIERIDDMFIEPLAFSPDGERILLGLHLFDVATGEMSGRVLPDDLPDEREPRAVTFSPDGKWLAVGMETATRVIDVATGREVLHVPCEMVNAYALDFSPDGRFLLTPTDLSDDADVLGIFETGTWQQAATFTFDSWSAARFAAESEHLILGFTERICVVNWRTAAVLREFDVKCYGDFTATADGRFVFVNRDSKSDAALLLDTVTGEIGCRIACEDDEQCRGAALSPDARVAVTGMDDGVVHVWDLVAGHEIAPPSPRVTAVSVMFSADGSRVRVQPDAWYRWVIDTATGAEIPTTGLEGTEWLTCDEPMPADLAFDESAVADAVKHVAVSPDGSRVVLGTARGMVFCFRRANR